MPRWPERRNAKQQCGCCGRRTVVIIAFGAVRLCACDPDAPTCHQCSRGRCHCKCVPARISDAPAPPATFDLEIGMAR